jgi:hypothetical protein
MNSTKICFDEKREYLYKKQYLLNTQICFAAMILIEIDTIGDGLVQHTFNQSSKLKYKRRYKERFW